MKGTLLLSAFVALGTVGVSAAQQLSVPTSTKLVYGNTIAKGYKSTVNAVEYKSDIVASAAKATSVAPLAEGDFTVSYQRPTSLYVGFDGEGSFPYYYMYLMPCFTDLTWTNTSEGISTSYWTYSLDMTNEETSTETDLTLNLGEDIYISPTLTGTDGEAESSYTNNGFVKAGGMVLTSADEGQTLIETGATVINTDGITGQYGIIDCFGKGAEVDAEWTSQIAALGATYTQCEGFGVYVPQQLAPYAISQVYVGLMGVWNAGAEIHMSVYKCEIDQDGYVDGNSLEEIASATTVTSSAMTSSATMQEWFTFNLETEIDGIPSEGFVTIDSPIYIEINGYNDNENITAINPAFFADESVTGTVGSDGYIHFNEEFVSYEVARIGAIYQGQPAELIVNDPYVHSFDGTNYFPTRALNFSFNACFNYLELTADGQYVATSTSIPVAGGDSDAIMCLTYPNLSIFDTVSVPDEDGDNVVDGYDWLSYEIDYGYIDEATGEGYYPSIVFSADALPAGVNGRTAEVAVSVAGANPVNIYVIQGEGSGVESVVATSAAKVTVEGGNFVVNAPEAINGVTVYNVAGQAVAASEIAGTTTVDASSLAKGVYVLRFNDGSTVKVIK